MKKQNTISTCDKLFIGCAITDTLGQMPEAVSVNGQAMMFNTEYGNIIVDFEQKSITIHEFTWDSHIMEEFLELTDKRGLDLILQLPDGQYNIFRFQDKENIKNN